MCSRPLAVSVCLYPINNLPWEGTRQSPPRRNQLKEGSEHQFSLCNTSCRGWFHPDTTLLYLKHMFKCPGTAVSCPMLPQRELPRFRYKSFTPYIQRACFRFSCYDALHRLDLSISEERHLLYGAFKNILAGAATLGVNFEPEHSRCSPERHL